MSNNELSPQGNQNPLAKITGGDQARKTREAYNAKASSDFYGAVGGMIGFLITLFATGPILFYLARNASLETRGAILAIGFAIAWWFNPLSLGLRQCIDLFLDRLRDCPRTGFKGLVDFLLYFAGITIPIYSTPRFHLGGGWKTGTLLLWDLGLGCIQWVGVLGDC